MAFQDTIKNAPGLGSAGREARNQDGFRDVVTLPAGGTVPFGVLVARNSDGEVTVGGATPIGVALAFKDIPTSNTDSIPENGDVQVMRKGYVVVTVAGAVNPSTAVRYLTATGEFTTSPTNSTALTNASYETSADAGGVAILRVNL